MAEASPHPVQHHAPPQSFIRKHVFSVDHKVIGKQYYGSCGYILRGRTLRFLDCIGFPRWAHQVI